MSGKRPSAKIAYLFFSLVLPLYSWHQGKCGC